jgi:methylated-DNA-protein-cysteine methyltransferase-like protein
MKAAPKNKESIYDAIYSIVRCVPKGRVTSYGAVATAIGAASGARVNRNGLLTGKHHFSPPEKMQQLLEKEGIKVKEDKVVDFETLFWDPMKELSF